MKFYQNESNDSTRKVESLKEKKRRQLKEVYILFYFPNKKPKKKNDF